MWALRSGDSMTFVEMSNASYVPALPVLLKRGGLYNRHQCTGDCSTWHSGPLMLVNTLILRRRLSSNIFRGSLCTI